jgi:hypothetical protein
MHDGIEIISYLQACQFNEGFHRFGVDFFGLLDLLTTTTKTSEFKG